jgi:hypothetical protein
MAGASFEPQAYDPAAMKGRFRAAAELTTRLDPEADRREIEDTLVKVGSAMYEKASAYANLLLAAGYAGIFGVWSLTKSLMTTSDIRWVAVLTMFSLFVFVAWEIIKMISASAESVELAKLIQASTVDFKAALANFQRRSRRKGLIIAKVWPLVLLLTIVPGLWAAGLLIASQTRALFAG